MTETRRTSLAYTDEHEIFRASARRFFDEECVPLQAAWREAGMAPRSIWKRAGELGFLCPRLPEEYGGAGADFLFSVILLEEQARSGAVSPMLSLHSDVVAPYIAHYGTAEQKAHFLPRMAAGDYVGAIGMTEPSGGSDLKNLRTTARREGDGYVINGQKTFISNGITANLLILAAQTAREDGGRSVSLFLVDTDEVEGFKRGRNLKKLGQKACDTAELFFEDMRVPAFALLGETQGQGFPQLMNRLVEERLMTAVAAMGIVERALGVTIDYVKERKAFGQRIIDFQNTRFKLAECKTEAKVLRVFLDRCIQEFVAGELDAATAAMLKYWATEQQVAIVDQCVQLHGGYGYILDYPIAQMWADGRIARIYGGANEVMKDIIGRTIR
jgi:acyl-CoA dehydrogenase